jgi:hypothetical protein
MPKFIGRLNTLVIPLITWLVLLIPFAIYQRYYVKSQQTYLTEHGFRVLSAVGRQLDTYLDSINKTVKIANTAALTPSIEESKFRDELKKNDYKKNRELYLDYLRTFHPELPPNSQSLGESGACTKPKSISVEFGPQLTSYSQCFEAPVSGRLSLDNSIRDRLTGIGEDYFDDILIAKSSGDVLFQRSQSSRIINLDYLVADGGAAGIASSQTSGNSSSQAPHDTLTFPRISGSSSVRTVKLGGEDYNLFLQPFQLTAAGADATDGGRVIICGLWRTDRLNSESFALPYSYVVWFSLICVAAGSFVWPFLKINYMNKAERLRRSQGWLLVLSMFLGISSVTLMVLNRSYSSSVQSNVDTDLRRLADQIQINVDAELRNALDQLDSLGRTSWVQKGKNGSSLQTRTEVLLSSKSAESTTDSSYPLTYPFFDIAFWTDQAGNQRVKLTADRYPTPQTPVNDRAYFQDIISGQPERLAELQSWRYGPKKYSLQTLFSPNTGLFSTIVATPFEINSSSYGTQALVFRPVSLVDPVLPADFGFAVLDQDGNVQFHSNSLRNISENFIRECKDSSALQAAIFSNLDHYLDLVYSGKDRRVLVTSIKNLSPQPLTLIVFYNTEITQTTNMAIILIGSVLMSIYVGVLLVIAVIDLLQKFRYPPVLIWPQPEYSSRYILVVLINSALVGTFLYIYSRQWEFDLLFITTITLALSISCSALVLKVGKLSNFIGKENRRIRQHYKSLYALAAVSLLVAVSVIPCFGFFKFSRDAASELAAKHGQLKVLNDVLLRGLSIRKAYSDLKAPNEIAANRIATAMAHYEKIPLTYLSFQDRDESTPGPAPGRIQEQFDVWLEKAARLFPSSNLGGEMGMLQFETNDGAKLAEDQPQSSAVSEYQPHPVWKEISHNSFAVAWAGHTIYSHFQEWSGVGHIDWAVLLLLWFFVGLWFFQLMKKVIVPDRLAPPALDIVNWKQSYEIQRNYLVLGDPRTEKSERVSDIEGIRYSDLRVDPEKEIKNYSPNDVVVLDHFDFNMDNTLYNWKRLQILERLVYKQCCRVVLVSSVDPVYFFNDIDSVSVTESAKAAPDFLIRWSNVMSSFQKVAFEDTGISDFDNALREAGENTGPRPFLRWIEKECRHTPYLRSVGRILLAKHQHETDFRRPAFDNELRELTDSYYSLVWSALSPSERLILFQLANDGWANHKNGPAIRQLLSKHLIRCAPMFKVMNESFRLFVREAKNQRQIAEMERQGGQSSWRSMKIALLATAIGLGAWLFYAQKDLFQGLMGYILSLGAAIAAIANILGGLKGRASNATKSADTGSST